MNHIALPLSQPKSSHLFLNPSHSVTLQCKFQDCGKSFQKQQDFDKHIKSHPKQSFPAISSLLSKGSSTEGFSAYVQQNLSIQDSSIQCKDEETCCPHTTSNARERTVNHMQAKCFMKTECKIESKAQTPGSDVSTEGRTICGKRPLSEVPFNEESNEDDEDDQVTLALLENQALKKRLFVTRATVLAVYRQLVFLEGFVSKKRAY